MIHVSYKAVYDYGSTIVVIITTTVYLIGNVTHGCGDGTPTLGEIVAELHEGQPQR